MVNKHRKCGGRNRRIEPTMDESGDLLYNHDQIRDSWGLCYADLLSPKCHENFDENHRIKVERDYNDIGERLRDTYTDNI